MKLPIGKAIDTLWFLYGAVVFALFFSVWDQPLGRDGTLPIAPTLLAVVALIPFFISALLKDLASGGVANTIGPLRENRLPLTFFALIICSALGLSLLPEAYWGEDSKWIFLIPYGFVITLMSLYVPLHDRARKRLAFYTFVALCLLLGSMIADVVTPGTYSSELTRAAGFPGNANFAALVTVMLCAAALDYSGRRAAWIDGAFLFVGGVCVLITMSRSGILNFLVLTSFYVFHRFIRRGIRVREVLGLTFGLGVLITALFVILPLYSDDLTMFQGETRLGRFFSEDRVDDGSAASRYAAVQDSLRLINESPILGHGTAYSRRMADLPHNLYLMQWVNNGLPGLLSYLGLLACAYFVFRKRKFRAGQAFILVSAVGSLFSHNLLDQRPFLMLLGILLTKSALEAAERRDSYELAENWYRHTPSPTTRPTPVARPSGEESYIPEPQRA